MHSHNLKRPSQQLSILNLYHLWAATTEVEAPLATEFWLVLLQTTAAVWQCGGTNQNFIAEEGERDWLARLDSCTNPEQTTYIPRWDQAVCRQHSHLWNPKSHHTLSPTVPGSTPPLDPQNYSFLPPTEYQCYCKLQMKWDIRPALQRKDNIAHQYMVY